MDALTREAAAGGLSRPRAAQMYAGPALRAVSAHRPLLGLLAALGAAVALAYRYTARSALAERVSLAMVPTESFDPTPEAIRRWAAAIAATRRRWAPLTRRASAVRLRLGAGAGGAVEMTVTCPKRAAAVLAAACPHEVELVAVEAARPLRRGTAAPTDSSPYGAGSGAGPRWKRTDALGQERRRAELVLGRGAGGLAVLGLAPDPLVALVAVLADLGAGEDAEVCIDLMPLSAGRRRRELAAAMKEDRESRSSFGSGDAARSFVAGLNADPLGRAPVPRQNKAPQAGRLERREESATVRDRHDRLSPAEPAFEAQVLVCASGPRAGAVVDHLVAGFAVTNGRNAWVRAGWHFGPLHVGTAQSRGRRWSFDRRLASGWFSPRRRSVVTAAEMGGMLKPPSVHCPVAGVRRSGGLVPPPPPGLPDWTPGAPGLWPLGTITEKGVQRTVGVGLAKTYFTASFGNSGGGKTAPALVRMAALARLPESGGGANGRPGLLYIDPHADGNEALMGYLLGQADRLTVFDLSREDSAAQGSWNPLDMTGSTPAGIGRRVSLFTAAYSALVMSRGLTLVTMSVTALCELNLQLPPHLQCTIFQLPTLLGDERWRGEVVRFLSPHQQAFWTEGGRIGKQSGGSEATGPVTNPIDRLRSSRAAAALFGQSRSSFDMRRAMDAGDIVLVCPGSGEDKDTLVAGLFLFELHLAARSRRNLREPDRRPFHAWVDEMQIADRGEGGKVLAQMIQEDRKFGLRLHGMVQQPTSLQKETLTAILTSRSHMMSTAVGYESAGVLTKNMGGAVDANVFTTLPEYTHVASVTHAGKRSKPFRLGGLYLGGVFGPPASAAELAAMEAVIDASMGRRPTGEVLAELDTLDGRILDYLRDRRPRPSGTVVAGEGARRSQRRLAPAVEAGPAWSAG